MHHRREADAATIVFGPQEHEHTRDTDTAVVARHILGMPIAALAAIGALVIALFGVWLAHDRAIAAEAKEQQQAATRIEKLEKKDEERTKQDSLVTAALARIETKIDDVKERVQRVENNQSEGHKP